ncbi:MAG: amino acid adenylation domain-containing protein, partial [bacterium]|nr:amino acid adenylation domain-containing protein [bacterium]
REDIVVGIPIAARRYADLQNIIGMFVNTLAIRNYPEGGKTFHQFLTALKERVVKAYEHQEYQFEELVEILSLPRDARRNPVFDVMLNMGHQAEDTGNIPGDPGPGIEDAPCQHKKAVAKFDLTLTAADHGERLSFNLNYGAKLFKESTIERFIGYLKKIISWVVDNKDIRIADLNILSEEEKKRLLIEFNDTHFQYPKGKTIHRLFEEEAKRSPDQVAVTCSGRLSKQEQEFPCSITYGELDRTSSRAAGLLLKKGVKPGTIVAVLAERTPETVVGIMGILKAGAAYLPIEPDSPPQRIEFMLKDGNVKVLLCKETHHPSLNALGTGFAIIPLGGLKDIEKDSPLPEHTHAGEVEHENGCVQPDNPAYVIYTSGSTGKPKGVLVPHHSVVNLAFSQINRFGVDKKERVLQFASICFDASVEQIFIAFFSGAAIVLVQKDTILDGDRFNAFIARQAVTHIHAVPSFLMNMELDDTASLKRVISGGDVCPPTLAEKWASRCDFYNEYGPTETTVTSLEMQVEEVGDTHTALPVGKPIGNIRAYILDKYMKLVPAGVTGELVICGEGIACGYLNRPQLTAEKFGRAVIGHSPASAGRLPQAVEYFYRTGDLARWLPDGNLEFLGRMDNQVKVRGFRIETDEIENLLLRHNDIKEAAVVCRPDTHGDNELCAYIVPRSPGAFDFSPTQISAYLSQSLPQYMIPAFFMEIDTIPLNANGKILRSALPEPQVKGEGEYAPPNDPVEEALVAIWTRVLSGDQLPSNDSGRPAIGIDDDFFHLGGHSLKATVMASHIHKEMDVNIPLAEIFRAPTIRGLARYIKGAAAAAYYSIEAVEKRDYYPLSAAQKRMFILQRMNPHSTAYNMPEIIPMAEEPNRERLENTINLLIRRHESLRTSFQMVHEEPVQQVHNFGVQPAFRLEETGRDPLLVDSPHDEPGMPGDFIRPFDLARAPLLRVELRCIAPGQYVLLVDMHHIISDGVSHGILRTDFAALYRDGGEELHPLRIQYKDFSQWQNSRKQRDLLKDQESYWVKQLEGELPVLDLPMDYPRPAVRSFEGDTLQFEVPAAVTRSLKASASAGRSTLFIQLAALFSILTAKLANSEDIIVGIPVAGRRHADLENIIGMFVNTLPLRNHPRVERTLDDFFDDVKKRTLDAFENQEYQLEDMVEKIDVPREPGRNPFFDVLFTLHAGEAAVASPGDSTAAETQPGAPAIGATTSKFDISLHMTETPGGFSCTFEYCVKLFKKETVHRFARYFNNILAFVVDNPRTAIGAVEIMSAEEKEQVLYDFNRNATEYPAHKSLNQIF